MGQSIVGYFTSPILKAVEEKQREAAIQQQLLKLKTLKKRRDFEISTKMATMRDRVWWLGGFYSLMATFAVGRMIRIRQFDPLPLHYIPMLVVPFWMAYLTDFSYGTKANRINQEALKIMNEEDNHWFNEPMEIPELLKPHYHKMFEEHNKKLLEQGKKTEKHWAK